jgi:hypothetical protein
MQLDQLPPNAKPTCNTRVQACKQALVNPTSRGVLCRQKRPTGVAAARNHASSAACVSATIPLPLANAAQAAIARWVAVASCARHRSTIAAVLARLSRVQTRVVVCRS